MGMLGGKRRQEGGRGTASSCTDPDERPRHLSQGLLSVPMTSPGSWGGGGVRRARMGKGGWRISKPLSSSHLQSEGMKPRSNCVERKKLGKGHHFHFPWEQSCFQERGKKSAPPPAPNKNQMSPGPVLPDLDLQSWSPTSGDPPTTLLPQLPGALWEHQLTASRALVSTQTQIPWKPNQIKPSE